MSFYRFFTALACIIIMITAPSLRAQNYLPNGPTLGGVNVQAVLDYFKALPHPHLLINYHNSANVAALRTKKDAGNPLLSKIWTDEFAQNAYTYRIYYAPTQAAIYYNLMGMGSAEKAEFINKVKAYVPNARANGDWDNYLDAGDLSTALFAYDACASTISAADKNAFITKMLSYIAVMNGETMAPGGTGNITENIAAALGMCAICFPDHPSAYDWLDHSLKFLQAAYHQMENEACIAEGPSYQLGFSLVAMVSTLCQTLEEHGFPVVSANDNFLEEIFMFMVKSMRPDKASVETEDCFANTILGGIWPAKYIKNHPENRRALQWYFNQVNGGGIGNYISYNLSLDPALPPQWNPTQFFPVSSCAVFRTDFEAQGTWLYFLGDRMPFSFSWGGVGGWTHNKNHGHNDATSITLYAHGDYLLTETARFRGTTANYHNLIMVDNDAGQPAWGIASSDKFTRLSNTFATNFCDGADMAITYKNTNFTRTVLFAKKLMTPAENEYFIMIDDIEATDGTNHAYDLQFHNKRGDITGSGTKKWITQTNNALAEIHFLEPDLASVIRQQENVGDGSIGSMDFVDHRILARSTGQKFQFVTLIYPRSTSMGSPAVTEINGTNYKGGKFTINNNTEIILSQKGNAQETADNITSNAKIAYLRLTASGPEQYLVKQGSLLKNGTNFVLESDVLLPVATLRYSSNTQLSGYLKLDQAANITFYSRDGATSSWKYLDAGEYPDFSFTLATGGIVRGRVTDQSTGIGISSVRVEAVQGTDTSYCYTVSTGNYQFLWVRPGSTTLRFVKAGYTTTSSVRTVTSGQSTTLDQVLTITTSNPVVTSASVIATTSSSVTIRVATDKLCLNQISYGTTTAYGAQTVKTGTYKDADTITITGLTGGTRYHFKAQAWDFGNRRGESGDNEFVPVGEFRDDFNDNAYTSLWQTTTPGSWTEAGGVLRKSAAGNFATSPQRLKDLMLAQGQYYGSFTLTTRLRSLRASDMRDACVVFNYQDDTHYYYAQFSMTASDVYNGIFMVNGTDRVKVGNAGSATLSGENWLDVKIVRDLKDGSITVYTGSQATPAFTWTDNTFGLGRIGLGSERSIVEFDSIHIWPAAIMGNTMVSSVGQAQAAWPTLSVTPNPLTGRSTRMEIALGNWEQQQPGSLRVTVHRPDGSIVKLLLDQFGMRAPERLVWDKTDHQGQPVEAGVYLVYVQLGDRCIVKKLALMRD